MTQVQNRKNRNLYKGFEISKKERNRAVAVEHVIDVDKRKSMGEEPKFTE